jgi:hypothetical protein
MNDKMGFALLAIGLIASLGIAASDCINVYTVDRNNESISGADVFLEGIAYFVGETDSNGYLQITLEDNANAIDHVYNVSTSKGTKIGYAMVTVPPGTCQNATIPMLY